ncbi:MAG TPA: hypothetical protein VF912_09610 [Anaeromyxobacter sp.]
MAEVLERGDIYFFYRPRVRAPEGAPEDEARGPEDVQRFFIILSARDKDLYRRIVVGRKKLPDVTGERFWGFVDQVARHPEPVREELGPERYETATRGERFQPGARPAGEGVYAIVRHDDHSHLAYQLELPEERGDVQRDLEIKPKASYVVVVKNPEAATPPGAGLPERQKAELPGRMQEQFRGRKFMQAEPQLLDHEGAEVILIGADEDVPGELGIELHPERETLESAQIFRDLSLPRSKVATEPLTEGRWR